jgi:hypothetical protein
MQGGDAMMLTEAAVRDLARELGELVRDPAGWMIRLVHCDPDSPDL